MDMKKYANSVRSREGVDKKEARGRAVAYIVLALMALLFVVASNAQAHYPEEHTWAPNDPTTHTLRACVVKPGEEHYRCFGNHYFKCVARAGGDAFVHPFGIAVCRP